MYRILIVDDEPLFVDYLKSKIDFEKLNATLCGTCEDGKEALSAIQIKRPDIVFVDINMPFLTGIEVCEAVKDMEDVPRIIILTAYDEFEYVKKAIRLGVSDYLLKPFDEAEVESSIKKCIGELEKKEAEQQILKKYSGNNVEQLLKYFERGQFDKVDTILKQMFDVENGAILSLQYVITIYYSLVTTIMQHYSNYQLESEGVMKDKGQFLLDLNTCNTVEEIFDVVKNALYEILSECIESYSCSRSNRIVGKIEAFLNENYANKDLNVQEISKALFFENSYLRKIYKTECNCTIMQELEEIRMTKAKDLLVSTNEKLNDIAEQVGYSDPFYFSRRFKLYSKYSPSKYREIYGKLDNNEK